MAKIVFLQQNRFDLHGLMYISGLLKHHGHTCRLLIAPEEKKLFSLLKEFSPDFVAFSLVSIERVWALECAANVKKNVDAITIFGGIDPTVYPDVINHEAVDIVCRGEGEYPLLELLDNFDKTGKISFEIENLWFKNNGTVIKNQVRSLIEDLDVFPMIDRELYYDRYDFLGTYPMKKFMVGRGCPFNCSYCCNKMLRDLYKGKGKYVRRHGMDRVLNEIKRVKEKYGMRMIEFIDDDFTANKQWLRSFLNEYREKIKLPFSCLVRIDLVDEEIADLLKKSGCVTVSFGLESGDQEIRNNILKKRLSDDAIIHGAAILKKYGLKFNTYNILNIPGETIESGFKTVNLNVKIAADFPQCSVFQPFPGTEFCETYVMNKSPEEENDFIKGLNFYASSPVKQKDSTQLINLEKFFYYAVKFPFLQPLIRALIKIPPNKFFFYFFLISFAYRHSRALNITFWEEIKFNARHIGDYFKA